MTPAGQFPPVVFVDLIEDAPFTQQEWIDLHPGWDVDDLRIAYRKYLDRHQPWRVLIKSGDNHEPLFKSTESYFNRKDALDAIYLAFGHGTSVLLRAAETGDVVLRQAT